MPQTVSLSSRTHSTATRHSCRRSVRVIMLDKQELVVNIENKSARVAEVFSQVCQLIDLRETDYFGLALLQDNEFQFVVNDTKLQKLAPKVWKSKDCSVDEPLLTFYFRVQYYVDSIGLLKEKSTRLHYYYQLRDNLLHYNQSVTEEKCFLLAGLALQADFGNYDQQRHVGAYFDPREFFPAWVMIRRGQDYITHHLPSIHRDLAGMSRPDARVQYIRDLSEPPVAHNMHFYRLRRRKYDPGPGNDWLAVCPKGLEIYEECSDSFKNLLSVFLWSNIGKLSCEKKKFEIVAEGLAERRFVYYASSKESGERLLDMCRASHRFQLSRQAQLSELKRLDEQDRYGVRHHEKYIYSENADFSSLDLRHVPQYQQLLKMVTGGSDRKIPTALRRSKNSIRAVSSPPSASTPVTDSEETRLKEIMIDSPPQITPFSLTTVTPITGHSTVWTSPSCDVVSGIENLLSSGSQRHDSMCHVQQPTFLPSPYSSTPQHAVIGPAVSRGSFIRSSASSAEGSVIVSSGNVSRVPPSILKQPIVSLHSDVTANYSGVPVAAADSQGSISAGNTSISAKSLQSTMPPGADLNDVISRLLTGKSAAVAVTPIRKSSLICSRSGLSPSVDVIRSTSLRQPARSDTDDKLSLRPGYASTELYVSNVPLPVTAHFQRIPFASPMTVTSNPVHSSSAGTATSSGRITPPPYHQPPPMYNHATYVEQPSFTSSVQSQRSNHVSTLPVGQSPLDSLQPSPLAAQGHTISTERRAFFDLLASETSASSNIQMDSTSNSAYRIVPFATSEAMELGQVRQGNGEETLGKLVAPPSYQMTKSVKATPPSARRYFEDIQPGQQARSSSTADLTNGDGSVHRSYVANPLLVTNERYEIVTNGPMSYMKVAHSKPGGVAVTQSSGPVVTRHVGAFVRQSSSTSTDSNDISSVQCLQHGSAVNIDDIKDNIGEKQAPMLKALCNDQLLRTSCTCNHMMSEMAQWTPPTPGTPSYNTTRRLSLSQPLSVWDPSDQQLTRPYSWASDHGHLDMIDHGQLDNDVISGHSSVELVVNGLSLGHRRSDGAACQTAYRMHTEPIMANH